jgi:hypothetical protein
MKFRKGFSILSGWGDYAPIARLSEIVARLYERSSFFNMVT